MRSDYIGQCAAFRGLPEYIGFSQFFVPRLNRVQLQDVIEEPASLSGNRITRRLTERLIHDLTEGVDQLPILQHALNQIWVAANNGQEEMDLVHYAMVGGMSSNELPEEQVSKFTSWFGELPPQIQNCYHQPNLQNVLDTHANKMYEEAEAYYKTKTGKLISSAHTKLIIKTAFKCLTKIDQSRAVRNRMTLEEITNVLAVPEIDVETVGSVLDIFREPGNTFIRPFINPDLEKNALKKTDVLDITHESLIRNWAYLESWAKEEYENYTIYLDYEQQLNRWVESDRSNDFLLSIGPLTYFENWYDQAKPNQWWVSRYLPEDEDLKEKLRRAKSIINNANAFLKGSARRHIVTRSIMKYGPKRIAAVLAIIGLITLSSFAVRNYLRQKNDFVLKSVKNESLALANKKNIGLEYTIPVYIELIKSKNISIKETLLSAKDPLQQAHLGNGISGFLILQGRNQPAAEILEGLSVTDSLMSSNGIPKNAEQISQYLKELYDLGVNAGFAYLYNPSPKIKERITNNALRSAESVNYLLDKQPVGFTDIRTLSIAIENGIDNKSFTAEELGKITTDLSPFENLNRSTWVQTEFHRDKLQIRGSQDYGFKFNGLYQELAYLYASQGNANLALKCIDTLLYYNQTYYQNDYSSMMDNASNIAYIFYQYGFGNELDQFVKGYSEKKNISTVEFYFRLVSRILTDQSASGYINLYAFGGDVFSNLNLRFSDDAAFQFLSEKLRSEINKLSNPDERNFNLAIAYKNEGIALALRKEMRGSTAAKIETDLFNKAIDLYQKVGINFLSQTKSVVGISGADVLMMPNRFQFLYPDYRVPFHPFEPRGWLFFYNSSAFINYVIDQGIFDKLYTNEDLKYFEIWASNYHALMTSKDFMLRDPMDFEILKKIYNQLTKRGADQFADINLLYLHVGNEAFMAGDKQVGLEAYRHVSKEKLLNSFRYKGYNFINSYSFEMVILAVANLVANNQFDEAYGFINVFKKEVNRSSIYGYASQLLVLDETKLSIAQQLLDSATAEMKRISNPAVFQPNRHQVAMALYMLDPQKNSEEAYRTIKNSFGKSNAISKFTFTHALKNDLYEAHLQIPTNISSSDKSVYYYYLLNGYCEATGYDSSWRVYEDNRLFATRRFLPYVNEDD